MECEGVWSRVFKDKSFDERESSKVNVCKWLARGYKEKSFNRSQTGNLITRLRKDYEVYCAEGGEGQKVFEIFGCIIDDVRVLKVE